VTQILAQERPRRNIFGALQTDGSKNVLLVFPMPSI